MSPDHFCQVADSFPHAAMLVTVDGSILAANRAADSFYGAKSKNLVGRNLAAMFPSSPEVIRRFLHRAAASETAVEHTDELRSWDGASSSVTVHATAIESAPNGKNQLIVRFEPEGERVGEEELRFSLERDRSQVLGEIVPQLVWTTCAEGKLDWCNQRWCDATGQSRAEAIGDGWAAVLHHRDLDRTLNAWKLAVQSGKTYEVEYRLRTPNGDHRWYIARAVPMRNKHGQITKWFGTCTDIHDQKLNEQAFRFLSRASATLGTLADYESTLQRVAWLAVPRFADWCAVDMVTPDGGLKRLAVAHLDPEKVRLAHELETRFPRSNRAAAGAMNVIQTGQSELVADIPDSLLQRSAQNDEHLKILRQLGLKSYICVPLKARDKVLGVVTFVASDTDRHYGPFDLALAEELAGRASATIENARLYDELRETDRQKDEFLAMLGHELRNPLTPIRMGLELLSEAEPEHREETIDLMREQMEHLVRLVDDLLEVSRIMRGKIELRCETVELAALLQRAVAAVRPQLQEQRQELHVALPAEPLFIKADPTRLSQVIDNLLQNASKYSDGGSRIDVIVEPRDGKAAVLVRDFGMGIEPELIPNVFDLFTQSARSLDRAQGGLGIGLTVVKRLVDLHGGTVTVDSEGPGKGSVFTIELPLANAHPAPLSDNPPLTSAKKRRVVVVDDNTAAALLIKKLLEKLGDHEIVTAHDGPSALDQIEQLRPELVLLDIGLPGVDGYHVAREVRRRPDLQDVVLIALTGYGGEEDRRRSRRAGFDAHFVKPPSIDQIRKILAHPRLAGNESLAPERAVDEHYAR